MDGTVPHSSRLRALGKSSARPLCAPQGRQLFPGGLGSPPRSALRRELGFAASASGPVRTEQRSAYQRRHHPPAGGHRSPYAPRRTCPATCTERAGSGPNAGRLAGLSHPCKSPCSIKITFTLTTRADNYSLISIIGGGAWVALVHSLTLAQVNK